MRKIVVSFSRRAALLCLALAVFNLHSAVVLAADAKKELPSAGELTIAGGVHVDGALALSGQTFFSGSTFVVAAGSRSTLTLHNHARLELSAETTLKLDFSDEGVTGALKAGRLRVFAPAGVAARLLTTDASILADSGQPAMFSVESGSAGGTIVRVEAGEVEMMTGKRRQLVSAGQSLSVVGGSATSSSLRHSFMGGAGGGWLGGIGHVVDVFTIILAGRSAEETSAAAAEPLTFGGCVYVLSPTNDPQPSCQ